MKSPRARNQEDEKLLEELMRLRPSRAIDRMLNEHSVDKAYLLYHALQQAIRKNTADLRSTLTQKYENLVDCSNLLSKIQTFTQQIEAIEQDISTVFHQQQDHQPQPKPTDNSLISLIEEQLYKKQYECAMLLSHSQPDSVLSERDRLYLPFLRIQILESLEQELLTKRMSSKTISETIACLIVYVRRLSPHEGHELVSNPSDPEEGALIGLVADALRGKEDFTSLEEGDMLEVVFKCKLCSLNRGEKGVREEERISKFFHDIFQLIGEPGRNGAQVNRLAEIFCKNLAQIESHLSETFIVTTQSHIISFRYDLYEQLLSSQEFTSILEQLHRVIAQHYAQAPALSLKDSFVNLWNNYYQQLLTLLFARCNPTTSLPLPEPDSQSMVPPELLKYFVTDQVSVQQQLRRYREELGSFTTTLKQLLSRTQNLSKTAVNSQQILKAIQDFYQGKVGQLNGKMEAACICLCSQPSADSLHSTVLLLFLCDEFNHKQDNVAGPGQTLRELLAMPLKWSAGLIQSFSLVFTQQPHQHWSIGFDTFFMKYNPLTLSDSKLNILREIAVTVLEGMLTEQDPERATALFSEWQQQREQQNKQTIDQQSRLADLPSAGVNRATFAKKKGRQGAWV